MKSKTANLALVSTNSSLAEKKSNKLHQYSITTALQTTLDYEQIIAIFSDKIQSLIPHSGCVYSNDEFKLAVSLGTKTHHSCSYNLTIENVKLGNLQLTRRSRFKAEELQLLESLLCCLVYPLQNAALLKQALQLAHIDSLTQTYNKATFEDTVNREINLALRNRNNLSVIFLDIDHFKSINDSYGHACGDVVLSTTAKLIKNCARNSDIIFRYGGEEFVLLLSNTDISGAELLAERIRNEIEQHTIAYDMQPIKITASIGVTSLATSDSLDDFIQRADDEMYRAKAKGRNQVCISK